MARELYSQLSVMVMVSRFRNVLEACGLGLLKRYCVILCGEQSFSCVMYIVNETRFWMFVVLYAMQFSISYSES